MKSISCLFFLLTWASFIAGCSQEERTPLDTVARMLEEKAPFYWEKEAFHHIYPAPSGKGKVVVDVNRVEVSELQGTGHFDVYLRNSVRIEAFSLADTSIWVLTANEGLLLPNHDFKFQKGVVLDLGEGFQLEAESLEINREARRFTTGPGFSLFTQVYIPEQDLNQFVILGGDSIAATFSFDKWEIKDPRSSLINPVPTIGE